MEKTFDNGCMKFIYCYLTIYRGGAMKAFVNMMKALSDPNRVKIVKLLQQKSMCVCELQGVLGLAQPTVSNHLKILEAVGLVDFKKDGLWVNYRVTDGKDSPYAASMLGNLRHWLNEDPEVMELVRMLPHVSRYDICSKKMNAAAD